MARDDPNATVQAESLPPDVLASIVRDAIRDEWDFDAESQIERREADEHRRLGRGLEGLDEI